MRGSCTTSVRRGWNGWQAVGRWCAVVAAATALHSRADDWPTYRHDNARSNTTAEGLTFPLAPAWTFRPLHAPQPAWEAPRTVPVEGILELGRVQFDDTFHVVVAGDALYFGSSANGLVYCLNAASGQVTWTRATGAPVRLAPTVADGRLYVGSDDGLAYCLEPATGRSVWEQRIGPTDKRLLGHGRMISMWPLRTGILVDGGTAYLAAGIWPSEGLYLEALKADTGARVWRNDTAGESTETSLSHQGYLLATASTLFVPQGRTTPVAFSRADGKMLFGKGFGKTVGGTQAQLVGGELVVGTEELMSYAQDTRAGTLWAEARQAVVTPDVAYLAADRELRAVARKDYAAHSLRRFSLRDQRAANGQDLGQTRSALKTARDAQTRAQAALADLDARIAAAEKADNAAELAGLKAQRPAAEQAVPAAAARITQCEQQIAKLEQDRKDLDTQWQDAGKGMDSGVLWRLEAACPDALVMAGKTLFAGGQDTVVAVDTTSGRQLWSAAVSGRARGLAVASGRLYVSTDQGTIHAFATAGPAAPAVVEEKANPNPFPADALSAACAAAADRIVKDSGVTRGYCLVVGAGTGRLALELARRTALTIHAVTDDAAAAVQARQALQDAGVYGSRVSLDAGPLERLPYSDYFANLIVCEQALSGALPPVPAGELLRVLKPHGGVLLVGQPAAPPAGATTLAAAGLRTWLAGAGLEAATVATTDGVWASFTRGGLPGEGVWTHQYADPGNTTCGYDQLVKCPLGILWFGKPGPLEMISRHRRAAAPLSVNGIMFVQGEHVVMAYDGYNGLKLWEKRVQNVIRDSVSHDCSNLAADLESFFVATGATCLRLDARTGEVMATYELPAPAEGRTWGYVAVDDGRLFGSRTVARSRDAEALFAIDLATGKVAWTHAGKRIHHPSISVGDGQVFLVDDDADAPGRREALEKRLEGVSPTEAEKVLRDAPVRTAYCLDAKTGQPVWRRPVDLTGGIGGLYWSSLGTMYRKGVLLIFGVYTDGHMWKEFFAGQFETRRVVALAGRDGATLWDRKIGYRVRPVIVDETLHAEPWAYDLRTGAQKMRQNPMTGQSEPWQFARPGHHCGCPAASVNCLFFRSYQVAYYDLINDTGPFQLSTQRAGCWINFVPGGGLLMVPEASSGCMCPFANMTSVVMKPVEDDRAWAKYSVTGGVLPAKHLAVNLGGPGDRRDRAGTMWLAYPRPGGSLVLQFKADVSGWPGGDYFRQSPDFTRIEGTDSPWLYTSGYRGLQRLALPLLNPGDGRALYTVRLGFAEPDDVAPGARPFDISLQGAVVQKGFDVAAAAGGVRRAVVREYSGVTVSDTLAVDLTPPAVPPPPPGAPPPPLQTPVLQAVEVVREKVVAAGILAPAFVVSDLDPAQKAEVKLTNLKDVAVSGTLQVTVPAGFAATPAATPVTLQPGTSIQLPVTVSVTTKGAAAEHKVGFRLVLADGTVEAEAETRLEYLGDRRRLVVPVAEDTSVAASAPQTARGSAPSLMVDGGDRQMNDKDHAVTFLRFRFEVPGQPLAVRLRITNAGNPTGGGGNVCQVTDPWQEAKLTYATRPALGPVVGKIGPVASLQVMDVPLTVDVTGLKELSLAVDPYNCDGVDYVSREGGKPAELVIEYR